MKKKFLLREVLTIVLLLCPLCQKAESQSLIDNFVVYQPATSQSETYRCFYDTTNGYAVNFNVVVKSNTLTIGSQSYSLRRLGEITNQGVKFKSYVYSSSELMFCVSTSQISVNISAFNTKTGYVVIINNVAYLATKSTK